LIFLPACAAFVVLCAFAGHLSYAVEDRPVAEAGDPTDFARLEKDLNQFKAALSDATSMKARRKILPSYISLLKKAAGQAFLTTERLRVKEQLRRIKEQLRSPRVLAQLALSKRRRSFLAPDTGPSSGELLLMQFESAIRGCGHWQTIDELKKKFASRPGRKVRTAMVRDILSGDIDSAIRRMADQIEDEGEKELMLAVWSGLEPEAGVAKSEEWPRAYVVLDHAQCIIEECGAALLPEVAEAKLLVARARLSLGHDELLEKSITDYAEYAFPSSGDQDASAALIDIGNECCSRAKYSLGRVAYEQVLEKSKDLPAKEKALFGVGKFCIEQRDNDTGSLRSPELRDRATSAFRTLLEEPLRSDDSFAMYKTIAEWFLRLNLNDDALKTFEAMLSDPRCEDTPYALWWTGGMRAWAGNRAGAVALFEKIVADFPDSKHTQPARRRLVELNE